VTPRNKTKVHIRTLAEIAKLLNDSAFREKLIAAESTTDVVSLIRAQETE
jgi:mannitol/fructose-specific phosphotransferase system IIA component (Ntr-type)